MAIDVYVGGNLESPKVFAIDQMIDGQFDEQKMVIGVDRIEDAIAIYLAAMPREMLGAVREISLEELRSYRVNQEVKSDAETFEPDDVDLPDLSIYDEFLDIDWEDTRNLAEEEWWEWDDEIARYRDIDGNPVTADDILTVTYRELDKLHAEVRDISAQLTQGTLQLDDWEQQMARIIVVATALFFLFGIGGKVSRIGETEIVHIEHRAMIQFEYLRQFSQGIINGEMTPNGIGARGELYVEDAQLNYNEALILGNSVEDWPYVSNILGSCRHCADCVEETARGIVPRDEMSIPGSRKCRWRCCCTLQLHKDLSGRVDSVTLLSAHGFGWVGGL